VARAAALSPLYALINNGAIFEPFSLAQTTLADWQEYAQHQPDRAVPAQRDFGARLPAGEAGRIVNILDWRAAATGCGPFSIHDQQGGPGGQ